MIDRYHKTLPSKTKSSCASVLYLLLFFSFRVVPYGLAVRIPGFHPGGSGSTPGMGINNSFLHQVIGSFILRQSEDS